MSLTRLELFDVASVKAEAERFSEDGKVTYQTMVITQRDGTELRVVCFGNPATQYIQRR